MPNTPCIVREGVSVFCVGDSATKDDAALVKKLMKSVGECEEVNEQLVDAVTGVSASGPAYMFMILGTYGCLAPDITHKCAYYRVYG